MSTSIGSLSGACLQAVIGTALQSTGLRPSSSSTTATGLSGDNGQLSPFAQLLSTLQQLQQSNPTQYQQVTQQIATNLQNAAQTASADGNTTAASQLNQLATDFSNASQSGQLPNVQDLAHAIGGGHHHHHGGPHISPPASSTTSSSTGSSDSTSASNSSDSLQQILAAFQSNASQDSSLNPLSIIVNTLSSAGIASQS